MAGREGWTQIVTPDTEGAGCSPRPLPSNSYPEGKGLKGQRAGGSRKPCPSNKQVRNLGSRRRGPEGGATCSDSGESGKRPGPKGGQKPAVDGEPSCRRSRGGWRPQRAPGLPSPAHAPSRQRGGCGGESLTGRTRKGGRASVSPEGETTDPKSPGAWPQVQRWGSETERAPRAEKLKFKSHARQDAGGTERKEGVRAVSALAAGTLHAKRHGGAVSNVFKRKT